MANIILVKNYQKRPFSEKAAKIAIEHFGWSEVLTPAKPLEVGTKTKPTIIEKPIKLKEFPIEKPMEEIPKSEIVIPAVDSGNEIKSTGELPVVEKPVKKPRKTPVKSKAK